MTDSSSHRAGKTFAPWTPGQVDKLNEFQQLGYMHEFTCAKSHGGERTLVAGEEGWRCPTCDYSQNWAHNIMLDPPPHPMRLLKQGAR